MLWQTLWARLAARLAGEVDVDLGGPGDCAEVLERMQRRLAALGYDDVVREGSVVRFRAPARLPATASEDRSPGWCGEIAFGAESIEHGVRLRWRYDEEGWMVAAPRFAGFLAAVVVALSLGPLWGVVAAALLVAGLVALVHVKTARLSAFLRELELPEEVGIDR